MIKKAPVRQADIGKQVPKSNLLFICGVKASRHTQSMPRRFALHLNQNLYFSVPSSFANGFSGQNRNKKFRHTLCMAEFLSAYLGRKD